MSEYTLMVSYDCGVTYAPHVSADMLDAFDAECADFNGRLMRWYIEDEEGNQVMERPCAIHHKLVEMMQGIGEP